MQSAGGPTPHCLRLLVFPCEVMLIALLAPLEIQGQRSELKELYSRGLFIGTTDAVRKRTEQMPQGYNMSALLSHAERAEVRLPPPPRGLKLAKYYRAELRKRFGITELTTCTESDVAVDCPSDYLTRQEPYLTPQEPIFLRLTYSYRPQEQMVLQLAAYRRDPLGRTAELQLPRKQSLAISELWEDLENLVTGEEK